MKIFLKCKGAGLLVDADELELVATVPGTVDPDIAVLVDTDQGDDIVIADWR